VLPTKNKPAKDTAACAGEMGKGNVADIGEITDEKRCALPQFEPDLDESQQEHTKPKPRGFMLVGDLKNGEQHERPHRQTGKPCIAFERGIKS